jgi:hypothetical protein
MIKAAASTFSVSRTKVTRPGLQKVFPSNTPVEVFNPAIRTAVSDRTLTSDELMGAARGRQNMFG